MPGAKACGIAVSDASFPFASTNGRNRPLQEPFGNERVNVLPLPGSLVTETVPP